MQVPSGQTVEISASVWSNHLCVDLSSNLTRNEEEKREFDEQKDGGFLRKDRFPGFSFILLKLIHMGFFGLFFSFFLGGHIG